MPTYIMFDDEPVQVPDDIVSEGGAAMEKWYAAEGARRGHGASPTPDRRPRKSKPDQPEGEG